MNIEIESTTDSEENVATAMEVANPESKEKETVSTQDTEKEGTGENSEAAKETAESKSDSEIKDDDDPQKEELKEVKEGDNEPKKNGFKKRIDRLNRKLSAESQEKEYWRQEALKQKQVPGQEDDQTQIQTKNDKPIADDFETHEEYFDARFEWERKQIKEARTEDNQKAQAQNAYQQQVKSHLSRVKEFSETTKDYEDVMAEVEDFQLSVGLEEAVLSSDLSANILYELAKDTDELERINVMTPVAVAREIGKIEARLENSKSPSKEKLTTKAPAPADPVSKQSGKAFAKTIFDADLSQAEYERIRNKRRA